MILVGIAGTVLLLTTFPMLSELVTGKKVTMGPPIYNTVNIPWALVLLLLAGTGPLIAWRKATASNLRRNFVFPALTGLWFLLLMLFLDLRGYGAALGQMFRGLGRLDVAAVLDTFKTFYPAMTFGLGAFVLATVLLEFYRGTRVRMHHHGEFPLTAAGRLMWHNKRRFGGYIVHAGVVVVFLGVAASSAYKQELVRTLRPGELMTIDDYHVRYDGYRFEAVEDHIASVTEVSLFDAATGKPLATLRPEQRLHPNLLFDELRQAFLEAKALGEQGSERYPAAVTGLFGLIRALEQRAGREVKTPSTEVAIHASLDPLSAARFGEDFYLTPLWIDPDTGQANFRIFINPMINFIWIGGALFVLGAGLAIMPDARERKRLEGALALEEKAVA
jgi:cytochrome c-type biogenesis protein CcmF